VDFRNYYYWIYYSNSIKDIICKPYKSAKLSDISNPFGANPQWYNGVPHNGVDWVSSYGTPLVAPELCIVDNIITGESINADLAPLSRGYGIILKGLISGKFHLYWHCLPMFPVKCGQTLKQGDVCAFMGNSGFVMTHGVVVPIKLRTQPPYPGTHLHQEVFIFDSNSQRVYENPLKLVDFSIPISYNLLTSIMIIIKKIINLILKK